jgi:hypothetical protein
LDITFLSACGVSGSSTTLDGWGRSAQIGTESHLKSNIVNGDLISGRILPFAAHPEFQAHQQQRHFCTREDTFLSQAHMMFQAGPQHWTDGGALHGLVPSLI